MSIKGKTTVIHGSLHAMLIINSDLAPSVLAFRAVTSKSRAFLGGGTPYPFKFTWQTSYDPSENCIEAAFFCSACGVWAGGLIRMVFHLDVGCIYNEGIRSRQLQRKHQFGCHYKINNNKKKHVLTAVCLTSEKEYRRNQGGLIQGAILTCNSNSKLSLQSLAGTGAILRGSQVCQVQMDVELWMGAEEVGAAKMYLRGNWRLPSSPGCACQS